MAIPELMEGDVQFVSDFVNQFYKHMLVLINQVHGVVVPTRRTFLLVGYNIYLEKSQDITTC